MMQLARQGVAYGIFCAFVWFLASHPAYRVLDADEAVISLTFSHAGQRVGECRSLTQDELNELPPNMRKPDSCPRERHPVFVSLTANGELWFESMLQPSGIWQDGKANVYRRLRAPAGSYQLRLGMSDTGSLDSFDVEQAVGVTLRPGQNLVIGFDDLSGKFTIE